MFICHLIFIVVSCGPLGHTWGFLIVVRKPQTSQTTWQHTMLLKGKLVKTLLANNSGFSRIYDPRSKQVNHGKLNYHHHNVLNNGMMFIILQT